MNYKMIGRFISNALIAETLLMFPALTLCVVDHEPFVIRAFLLSMVATMVVAGLLQVLCRDAKSGFYAQEGMICVGLCWIIMSLLGALPFYFSRQIPRYIDALFEIVSGFTTTGASVLPQVENLSRGILYWRSFSHWLGGMGVLVFLLAVIHGGKGSTATGFTLHLLRAESPGPEVGKLVPHMRRSATVLYVIYVVLTLLNIVFLRIGDMPWFDSVCTAFGTAGTGGFGIKNDSMASYSPYLQNVCTVFMLLFGVNFNLYFLLCLKQIRNALKDEELHLYVGIVTASVLLIAWNIRPLYHTLSETFRHAAFQVATIITTTGFATTNFDLWPTFSKSLLLCLMVVGACAGSTGGGIKCARVLLLLKSLRRSVTRVLHPQKVQCVRVNGHAVNEQVLAGTNAYLAAYVVIIMVSFLIISLDEFSVSTNFSAVIACFNNIGPGLEMVGPSGNYGQFSDVSKVVLIFDMLAGRLEIFPILSLITTPTLARR